MCRQPNDHPLPRKADMSDPQTTHTGNRYTNPVKFSVTNQYGCGPDDEDDVYTVAEFHERCRAADFVDYDGFGHPVKDSKEDPSHYVKPSQLSDIPTDATHIVWYNK